jgi:D-arabinose 1-dehydrogenase-like Zn-dependent alcohol dehydrogenase
VSGARARLSALGWDAALAFEAAAPDAPSPRGRELKIAVEACGVCHRDLIDREGRFPFIRLPVTPGHEAVGRVVEAGPDARDFQVGDRVATMHRDFCGSCRACASGSPSQCELGASVLGLTIDGGYATELVAPETCFFGMPEALPAAEAATLHCTFGTAYRGLSRLGGVGAGASVLVTGANGGVGSAAVQLGRRLGATVVGVVRDARHAPFVERAGAHRVIVDTGASFHKQMGQPADVALDCVGPPTFNAALRSLRSGGTLVVIGNVTIARPEVNLGYLVTRGLRVFGSAGASREDMAELLSLHAATPLEFPSADVLPLARADQAQRRLREGGVSGRLVLDCLGVT